MGFIFSFWCRTFVRYHMTILMVNGFWRYGGFVAHGALDQSSQEQTLPYFENHNHVHDHNNANDDGWCDCNAQGPWHPLFKPSQAVQAVSSEETSPPLENAIDASEHGHVHALPDDLDLHSKTPANLRKAKKQNHMIHLHLIPHIYVPVVHPVRHPVTYSVENGYNNNLQSNSHESHDSHESRPYSFEHDDTRNNVSPDEHENEFGAHEHEAHISEETMQHDDHSPFVPPEPAPESSQEAFNQDTPNYINSHTLGYTSNHESAESNYHASPDVNYHYLSQPNYNSEENPSPSSYQHQYQVHEDSPHEHYYGDYPSSSNTRNQILPLNSSVSYFKQKTKKKYHDRSRLNKKYMIFPLLVKKLRVMSPPPPAQVETWRTNMQYADSKLIPLKAYFDAKDLFKHPFFDFKGFKPRYRISMTQPTVENTIPHSQSIMSQAIPLTQGVHPNNLKSPILVYPTNALRKRRDKILRS